MSASCALPDNRQELEYYGSNVCRIPRTSAQREALYILRIVPNWTMYMHPYIRLMRAKINEKIAAHRVKGSPAASGTWNMVRMALRA